MASDRAILVPEMGIVCFQVVRGRAIGLGCSFRPAGAVLLLHPGDPEAAPDRGGSGSRPAIPPPDEPSSVDESGLQREDARGT